ncbi:MAG: hypothetical protein WBL88_10440 [Nitrososphaeraceae archaeon]
MSLHSSWNIHKSAKRGDACAEEEEEEVADRKPPQKPMMDLPYIGPVKTIDRMYMCAWLVGWLELKYHHPTP